MKFDNIVIGGGLSGLTAACVLAEKGLKTAVLSAGDSTLSFSSGGLRLPSASLSIEGSTRANGAALAEGADEITRANGAALAEGTDEITRANGAALAEGADEITRANDAALAEGAALSNEITRAEGATGRTITHPYDKVEGTGGVAEFFRSVNIPLFDTPSRQSYRISPIGKMMPLTYSFNPYSLIEGGELNGKKLLIIDIKGFPDFPSALLANRIQKECGAKCRCVQIEPGANISKLRTNLSEFRAINIANHLDRQSADFDEFISIVDAQPELFDSEIIIFPDIFSMHSLAPLEKIAEHYRRTSRKVLFVNPLPPTCSGFRVIDSLRRAFVSRGGTLLRGDKAIGYDLAEICDENSGSSGSIDGSAWSPDGSAESHAENSGSPDGSKIISLHTSNGETIEADNFILATGSFFSRGLESSYNSIWESIFNLDLDIPEGPRCNENFYGVQPYELCGVKTDRNFRTSLRGRTVQNLYAIGRILSGADRQSEGSAETIDVLTALKVAEIISATK